MNSDVVNYVSDLSTYIEVLGIVKLLIIFRGQPVKGNLLPGIARRKNSVDSLEVEQKTIEQLRLMGATFLSEEDQTTLDLLVLAQHFRLKTRLLDWTSNPLAALWFACADKNPGDVFVYALEADALLINDAYKEDPFSRTETGVFQPRFNNPRIVAQHGWFTLHGFSKKAGIFVPLENNAEVKKHLTVFQIPEGSRTQILDSLDIIGIGHRTLFPDLEGLCLHLNWKYQLE